MSDELSQALLATIGRMAFSREQLRTLIDPTGKGAKQIKAFNLADGSRTQTEIAKTVKIDQSQFSRLVSK